MKLKRVFNSVEKCYYPLLNFEVSNCIKCGHKEFYTTIENFEKVCRKCKTKQKNTHNTLFHNVRFGLLKAFHIYIEVVYDNPKPKASEIAKQYKITYKTAYLFKKRIMDDFEFMDLNPYLNKNRLSNEEKMIKYLKKITDTFID